MNTYMETFQYFIKISKKFLANFVLLKNYTDTLI